MFETLFYNMILTDENTLQNKTITKNHVIICQASSADEARKHYKAPELMLHRNSDITVTPGGVKENYIN